MLGPAVGILLDLNICSSYDARCLCFRYQEFLKFLCSHVIIVAILCRKGIKRLGEFTTIAVHLPCSNAIHVFTCIVSPNPLIFRWLYCRGDGGLRLGNMWIWYVSVWDGVYMWRGGCGLIVSRMCGWWWSSDSGGYVNLLAAQSSKYTIKLILIKTKKRYMGRQKGVIWYSARDVRIRVCM